MSVNDTTEENKIIAQQYKELLRISYQQLTDEDKKLIRKAFNLAVEAHAPQRRKSGEAYIFHPIAVAKIVANEIGLDATAIAAALLHDVVEDTKYTLEDIESEFGQTIATIVDGLTKIAHLKKDLDISTQAENFRKMLLTLNDDIRVIIIKIADRLHNMQTMESMPADKQRKIASETLYIYAPMAHRIGLYNIKTELEDLGLKYTEPEVYQEILDNIKESKEEQDRYIEEFKNILESSLLKEKLKYEIYGRPKSVYSIHRKMLKQGVAFDEVYDKFAVRIIFKSGRKREKFTAWKIYSIVTDHFTPNPVRLRDWISSPKSTGYEALHITVMGPSGRWVEVQIRSERMHEIAEKGYAAHYKYKQGDVEDGLDEWLTRLQEALENPNPNAVDFVEQFKLNLYSKEIFVFTPQGDLKSLPKGATALDFAFTIHTEVGMHCRGARVNNKLVPLSQELKSGDQVEIITSVNQKPSRTWLNYAITARARSKIKSSLKEEQQEVAEEGKAVLKRKLKSQRINLNEDVVTELVNHFKFKTSQDLFYAVGVGKIENKDIKEFASRRSNALYSFFKNKMRRKPDPPQVDQNELTQNYDQLVFGKDEQKLDYSLANCCNPIPGDQVFGFITVREGIKVHKTDCPNAVSLQSKFAYRIMSAHWIDSSKEVFAAILRIEGLDKIGLVQQITHIISDNMHVDIRDLNFKSNDGIFTGEVTVVVPNKALLQKIVENLKKVNGVDKVIRI
jgi:GTP pyrophosphokinase